MDSIRYIDCINVKLHRIGDVKQHLSRRHILIDSTFCECRPLSHLEESVSTTSEVLGTPDGISQDALDRLKRISRKLSTQEQWYSIWYALFKNSIERPRPHLGSAKEEVIELANQLWMKQGNEIISAFARERGLADKDITSIQTLVPGLFDMARDTFQQESSKVGLIENQDIRHLQNSDNFVTVTEFEATTTTTEHRSATSEEAISILPTGQQTMQASPTSMEGHETSSPYLSESSFTALFLNITEPGDVIHSGLNPELLINSPNTSPALFNKHFTQERPQCVSGQKSRVSIEYCQFESPEPTLSHSSSSSETSEILSDIDQPTISAESLMQPDEKMLGIHASEDLLAIESFDSWANYAHIDTLYTMD